MRHDDQFPVLSLHQRQVRTILSGDMFASGTLWIGPGSNLPVAATEAETRRLWNERGTMLSDLERTFVPAANMIATVHRNTCDHVAGAEPTWNLSGGADALRAEADAILTEWWNARRAHVENSLARDSLVGEGRAAMLLRIPAGALRPAGDTMVCRWTAPVDIARHAVRLSAVPAHETVATWEDDQLAPHSAYTWSADAARWRELAYVNDEGLTVCVHVSESDTETPVWTLDLGGRLPHHVASCAAAISPSQVRNQLAANVVETSSSRNTAYAGWVERWLHNISPRRNPDGSPAPFDARPGGTLITQDVIAEQITEEGGQERVSSVRLPGSYTRLEPVSSEPLSFAQQSHRLNIYAEARQLHYLMSGDATASGESRRTAMASFFRSLAPYRAEMIELLRWELSTVLAMIASLAGTPGRYSEITVEPRLTDRLTDPSAQDRAQDAADVLSGIISVQTARERQGILDPAAEQAQIDLERSARPAGTTPVTPTTPPVIPGA